MTENQREPGRLAKVLGGIGAVALLKALEKSEREKAVPGMVSANPKIQALAETAWTIADEASSPAEAVERMREAAHGRKGDLLRAAAIVRMDAGGESRWGHRADRLLQAAASGDPVAPETPEESAWFDEIEELEGLPVDEAFDRVARDLPALLSARARLLDRARAAGAPPYDDETNGDLFAAIWDEIDPTVGPKSVAATSLLRTRVVHNIVRVALAEQMGLTFED